MGRGSGGNVDTDIKTKASLRNSSSLSDEEKDSIAYKALQSIDMPEFLDYSPNENAREKITKNLSTALWKSSPNWYGEEEDLIFVGSSDITPGVLDGEVSRYYNRDKCWALAFEIHKKSGLPIAVIVADKNPESPTLNDTRMVHVLVRIAEDRFLDIDGIHTENSALREWSGSDYISEPSIEIYDDLKSAAELMGLEDGEDYTEHLDPVEEALAEDIAARVIKDARLEISRIN